MDFKDLKRSMDNRLRQPRDLIADALALVKGASKEAKRATSAAGLDDLRGCVERATKLNLWLGGLVNQQRR